MSAPRDPTIRLEERVSRLEAVVTALAATIDQIVAAGRRPHKPRVTQDRCRP